MQQHYSALNLSVGANPQEITNAYWKLAQENHPDKGGSPARYRQINNAYQILIKYCDNNGSVNYHKYYIEKDSDPDYIWDEYTKVEDIPYSVKDEFNLASGISLQEVVSNMKQGSAVGDLDELEKWLDILSLYFPSLDIRYEYGAKYNKGVDDYKIAESCLNIEDIPDICVVNFIHKNGFNIEECIRLSYQGIELGNDKIAWKYLSILDRCFPKLRIVDKLSDDYNDRFTVEYNHVLLV